MHTSGSLALSPACAASCSSDDPFCFRRAARTLSPDARFCASTFALHVSGEGSLPLPLRMKAPNSPTVIEPEPSLSSATHTALRAGSGSSLGVSSSSCRTRPSNST
eukprot:scaffold41553_cov69-Phaeocystis_antarctica.AAC.5